MPTDNAYKVSAAGNAGVGKTHLLALFDDDANTPPLMKFRVWDTPSGQEQKPESYEGSDAIILAFSLTDKQSFDDLERHLEKIKSTCRDAPIFLVGTKLDLVAKDPGKRAVAPATVTEFYKKKGLAGYYETTETDKATMNVLFQAVVSALRPIVPNLSEAHRQRDSSSLRGGILRRNIRTIVAGAVIFGVITALVVLTSGWALTLLPLIGLIVGGAALGGVVGGIIVNRRNPRIEAASSSRRNPDTTRFVSHNLPPSPARPASAAPPIMSAAVPAPSPLTPPSAPAAPPAAAPPAAPAAAPPAAAPTTTKNLIG